MKPIIGAIGTLAGGEMLARVAAFAATAMLARRLGPDGFGILGFAMAVCGYLALGVSGGLQDVGAREVARQPGRAAELYSSVASIRLVLAVVGMLLLAVVAWLIPKPPLTSLVLVLSGLSLLSLALDPVWVFKGLERPLLASSSLVLSQSVYALGILLVIGSPSDVPLVPILLFAGELTAALIFGTILFRHSRPHFALAAGWRIWQRTGYLGLARAFRTLVITSDIVLLGFMTTDHEVGLYTAAYRVAFLLMSIAAAVSAAYLPPYVRAVQGDGSETRRLVEGSLGMAMLIGAPLVAGVMVTARPLLALLFGSAYADATPAVQLLALSVGILFLYWPVSNLLIVAHRTRLYAAIHGASAVVNLILNLILIPRYGIAGAAAATLVAEASILVPGIVILWRMRVLPAAGPVLMPVVAAGGMSAVILGLGTGWPLAGQVALGGTLYAVLVAALGGRRLLASLRASGSAPGLQG